MHANSYFFEQNMFEFLTKILPTQSSTQVRIQLLQTISMLLHNCHDPRTLCRLLLLKFIPDYFLSGNFINVLISTGDLYQGDDVTSWMISLLKTLSGLLNETTIRFLYQENWSHFPLLDRSIKFLANHDPLKRAHAMTVFMNVLRVGDVHVLDYILHKSNVLSLLPLYLRQCWRSLNRQVKEMSVSRVGTGQEELISTIEDLFCFLQEVMDLEIPELNDVLFRNLFTMCFFPLFGVLIRGAKYDVDTLEDLDIGPTSVTLESLNSMQTTLCMEVGGIGEYNINRRSVLRSQPSVIPSLESPSSSRIATPVPSEPSTPRKLAEHVALVHEHPLPESFSGTVAYYLLMLSTSSSRRLRIQETLLLLLFCPYCPRVVLEYFKPDAPHTRETVEHMFHIIESYRQFALHHGPCQYGNVLNLLSGHFTSCATEALPRDNYWAILASGLSTLTEQFMMHLDQRLLDERNQRLLKLQQEPIEEPKVVDDENEGWTECTGRRNKPRRKKSQETISDPNAIVGDFEKEGLDLIKKFIITPGGLMHPWIRLFNGLLTHAGNIEFRTPVAHMGICNALKLLQKYPNVLKFHKELKTMTLGALDTIKKLVLPHFHTNPQLFISIFYEEWLRVMNHEEIPTLLTCPQVLYSQSQFSPIFDYPPPPTQPASFWLIKSPRDKPNSQSSSARREARNEDWAIPIKEGVLKRHAQMTWLLYRLKHSFNLPTNYPTLPQDDPSICPMLMGKSKSIVMNSPNLYLGVNLDISKVTHFPCKIALNTEVKSRILLAHPLLFLLARPNNAPGMYEITSIHPLWNTKLGAISRSDLSFTMEVRWESRLVDSTTSFPAAGMPSQTSEFKIVLESLENLTEYTTLYKLHLDAAVNDCIDSLLVHVYQKDY
ncbi:bifunctional CLEC16A-TT9 [Babesia duncani]|uniref:Bifunctional CLEC16A-TT9 n=1 Tax=Babesia duncani TaxID=323732 RepID=A0AAD9PIG1_9APIC|nr:bifunctional CLEC16A-TT9 [Babesia duncani]